MNVATESLPQTPTLSAGLDGVHVKPLPRQAGREERYEPGEGALADLPIRQDPGRPQPPAHRRLFPFGRVFPLGRKPGSAASWPHTHASRGLGLEPRGPVEPGNAQSSGQIRPVLLTAGGGVLESEVSQARSGRPSTQRELETV
jgi:hypothetical protein